MHYNCLVSDQIDDIMFVLRLKLWFQTFFSALNLVLDFSLSLQFEQKIKSPNVNVHGETRTKSLSGSH